MAINKNHEFEELNGVKCGIVEKSVPAERVAFLKKLLEHNRFTVVVVPTPPAKPAVVKASEIQEGTAPQPETDLAVAPETFTVGVTDYTFNTINAIFGRSLKTATGYVVTLAYWQQKETESHDEIPYYEQKK